MDAGSVVDGRYEVRRALSVRGGMGDVYSCLDRKLNREVALKLIKPEHANEPEYRERFQREIDAAIALESYDVVKIHDRGECSERHVPYYVMEHLRGRDLSQELAARGAFELSRALEILLDVCKVIRAAHARGIVHRDLKPSNLFLEGPPSPRRSVRVLDFGIARVLGAERDGVITQLGGQPGSPNYMSPEQHKNDPQVDVATDIWALGAILFETVVGEKAWPGESREARTRVLEGSTPSACARRPNTPHDLDRILQKCMQKEPTARYTSVRELERDLRELKAELEPSDVTAPTFARRAPLLRRVRRPALWAIGSCGSILAFGLFVAAKTWTSRSSAPAVGAAELRPAAAAHLRPKPNVVDTPSAVVERSSRRAIDVSAPSSTQGPEAAQPSEEMTRVSSNDFSSTRPSRETGLAPSVDANTPREPTVSIPPPTATSKRSTGKHSAVGSKLGVQAAGSSGKPQSVSTPVVTAQSPAPAAARGVAQSPTLASAPRLSRNETRLKTQ